MKPAVRTALETLAVCTTLLMLFGVVILAPWNRISQFGQTPTDRPPGNWVYTTVATPVNGSTEANCTSYWVNSSAHTDHWCLWLFSAPPTSGPGWMTGPEWIFDHGIPRNQTPEYSTCNTGIGFHGEGYSLSDDGTGVAVVDCGSPTITLGAKI